MRYIKLKDGSIFSFIANDKNAEIYKPIAEEPQILKIKEAKIHEFNSSIRHISDLSINNPDSNIIARWNEDN